ncbi:MAG TPA: DNA-binding protein [Candidatus Omnitrophica bacterium]|nr:DNA-binding protein [Candidatus Omnitrophota bacterium]
MPQKEIMEAKEVAEYLHLHPFTVHKFAREGKLPCFKIGNDWRFRRSAVEEWVKLQEEINHKNRSKSSSPKK